MRFADLLGLAFSALWQQKARTALATLGVLFGSFVLAASLSIGQGVRDTISRESHRSDYLRRIDVRPQWGGRESDIPAAELRVQGEMSDARRERLRKALLERKLRSNPAGPGVPLTRERLQALAALPHVEAVVPVVRLYGWALFDNHSEPADMVSAQPEHAALQKRVSAGRFFDTADERGVVVSEFLLYRWGVVDEAAMRGVVGKKLRLEFRVERPGAGIGLYLQKPGGDGTTQHEAAALDKIKKQLPDRLASFDLEPAEKEALRKAVQQAPPRNVEVFVEELPIVGVLRLPVDEELRAPGDRVTADVVLPLRAAEELFFRMPAQGERGVDEATVYVDREENVQEVAQEIRRQGLNGFGALEFIERQRLMYTIMFGAMTCVAAVALLVSSLGIANTMLMSVLERTREIGTMKAVGAGNRQVQFIFLVEGALIGLVGGGLGLVLSWAASFPGDAWLRSIVTRDFKIELKESLFVFPPWLLGGVVLFAILVTTLAAFFPAWRAANVNPITALRHE